MEQGFSQGLISRLSITWELVRNAHSHTLSHKWVGGTICVLTFPVILTRV